MRLAVELQPGDRLPSEADFEITRVTIRNAIQDLPTEGLVVSGAPMSIVCEQFGGNGSVVLYPRH